MKVTTDIDIDRWVVEAPQGDLYKVVCWALDTDEPDYQVACFELPNGELVEAGDGDLVIYNGKGKK